MRNIKRIINHSTITLGALFLLGTGVSAAAQSGYDPYYGRQTDQYYGRDNNRHRKDEKRAEKWHQKDEKEDVKQHQREERDYYGNNGALRQHQREERDAVKYHQREEKRDRNQHQRSERNGGYYSRDGYYNNDKALE